MSRHPWSHLPPKAQCKAQAIDKWDDYCDAIIDTLDCNCMRTRIKWVKDCGDFDDLRWSTIFDPCKTHRKMSNAELAKKF